MCICAPYIDLALMRDHPLQIKGTWSLMRGTVHGTLFSIPQTRKNIRTSKIFHMHYLRQNISACIQCDYIPLSAKFLQVVFYWVCFTVLLYYCTTVLLHYCTTVLLYYCTTVLLYSCTPVLLYSYTPVLLYYCIQ